MTKKTIYASPTQSIVSSRGGRRVTETSYTKTPNAANTNGGFDVSMTKKITTTKPRLFGGTKVKTTTSIDRNYNNPKTASSQTATMKQIYRKDGSEKRSKFK